MKAEEFRPLRDVLLVRVVPTADNAIMLPVDPSRMNCVHECWGTQYKVRWGKVLSAGPGRKDRNGRVKPTIVRVGDLISFGGMTKGEFGDLVVISEMDVMVVQHGEEN